MELMFQSMKLMFQSLEDKNTPLSVICFILM